MEQGELSATSIDDAVYLVLGQLGIGALENTSQFVSAMLDVYQSDTAVARVFFRNCDSELLSPYVSALSTSDNTATKLQMAARKAVLVLADERKIDPSIADEIANSMMVGIARYLGVGVKPKEPMVSDRVSAEILPKEVTYQQGDEQITLTSHSPREETCDAERANPDGGNQEKGREDKLSSSWQKFAIPISVCLIVVVALMIAISPRKDTWNRNKAIDASWTTTIDGNGATEGENRTINANDRGYIELPVSPFKRDGYSFVGWSREKGGKYAERRPGDQISKSQSGTYYAIWRANVVTADISITEETGTKTQTIEEWKPDCDRLLLRVKNDTHSNIHVSSTIAISDGISNNPAGENYFYTFIAPGETMAIPAYPDPESKDANNAFVSLEYDTADKWGAMSLAGSYSVEKKSVDSSRLVVRVTNTGSEPMTLNYVALTGRDKNNNDCSAVSWTSVQNSELSPGEMTDIVFNDDSLLLYDVTADWESVEPIYYIDGYKLGSVAI